MPGKDEQKQKIEQYVQAYNAFDIAGMLQQLHQEVEFENISNGQVNLLIKGIKAFQAQAERAKQLFRERAQRVTCFEFNDREVEAAIAFSGVLAKDLPNGLKAGDTISLNGKSTFTFQDGKIIKIKDES